MLDLSFSMSELEYFLVIVVRVTAFIFAAPFFSNGGVPSRVKIGFGILLSVMLYNIMTPVELEYNTVLGYAVIVIKEALVGVIIGYSANICTSILAFAGHMVDMEIGLSMVTLYDPVSNQNITITGVFYQYTIGLMLLISGLYQYVISAIAASFDLIPINGAIFSSDKLLSGIVGFMGDYLSLGFRVCLPVFAVILIVNSVLGMLAKVSPQLNMFAVGIQIKILAGLGVMFITVSMLPTASTFILSETKKMITVFVEAMQ